MSTLIICKNSIAASPYYIEEASLNVYSLEELSYYILNNVYLLSSKLMSPELCNWIGRELKNQTLSKELLGLVQSNAPLHIFVGHILSANGYSSNKEIKDVLSIIDAVYEYETLLADDLTKQMSAVTEGDVYHNLGCAFAKLFLFDEAIKCFDEGYKRNHKKQTLYCLLYANKCAHNEEGFQEFVKKYQVPNDEIYEVNNIILGATNNEKILDFDRAINDLLSDDSNRQSSREVMTNIINSWKKEYIKLCKI